MTTKQSTRRKALAHPTAPTFGVINYAADAIGSRDRQEDAGLVLPLFHVLVAAVFDGMGGHEDGDVASRTAALEVETCFRGGLNAAGLARAIVAANTAVWRDVSSKRPAGKRPGTTVAAVAVDLAAPSAVRVGGDSVAYARVAHVGDSRVYRLRGGVLEQLTKDHGPPLEEIDRVCDALRAHFAGAGMSTVDVEAVVAARRGQMESAIPRALGIEPREQPDVQVVDVLAGDALLLATDGLTLSPERIAEILTFASDPAKALVAQQLALVAPKQDNVTCIVLRFAEVAPKKRCAKCKVVLEEVVLPGDPHEVCKGCGETWNE